MTIYTFDCRRADMMSICLELEDLADDDHAIAFAEIVLARHDSGETVEVFEDERPVEVVRRRIARVAS